MEDLIARYGLIAICLGSGLEGEPFALAGGMLAHRNWLAPAGTTLAAIAGSFLVDQFWFHLSRNVGHHRFVMAAFRNPSFRHALERIERNPALFVLLFRFAYGLRAVTAIAVGASRMPTARFISLNMLAATVWGSAFTGIGYALGPSLEQAQARHGTLVTGLCVGASVLMIAWLIPRARR